MSLASQLSALASRIGLEIKAKINADGDTVEVPCMDSVLIGNSENSEELVDAIADTMLYKSKAIVTQGK